MPTPKTVMYIQFIPERERMQIMRKYVKHIG